MLLCAKALARLAAALPGFHGPSLWPWPRESNLTVLFPTFPLSHGMPQTLVCLDIHLGSLQFPPDSPPEITTGFHVVVWAASYLVDLRGSPQRTSNCLLSVFCLLVLFSHEDGLGSQPLGPSLSMTV